MLSNLYNILSELKIMLVYDIHFWLKWERQFVRLYIDRQTYRHTDKQTYRSQVKGPILEDLFNDVVIWSKSEIIPT